MRDQSFWSFLLSREISRVPRCQSSGQREAARVGVSRIRATRVFLVGGLLATVVQPGAVLGAPLESAQQIVQAVEQKLATVSSYRCQLHNVSIVGTVREERMVVCAYELYDETGQLIYRQHHEALALNAPLAQESFNL